jgi:alkane 1-monooxygenase
MPAKHLIAFLCLAAVPLAEEIGGAAPFLVVPGLLVVFAGLDRVLGLAACSATVAWDTFPHRVLPWLYIALQLAAIAWGVLLAARETDLVRITGLALAMGAVGGIFGVLAAHEMIHSASRAERALGTVMLAGLTCLHFRIAHLHLHHRLAATPADPSTARQGESFYRFMLRSFIGQWLGAWRFEKRRAAQRGRPILANRAYCYLAITAIIYLIIAASLGSHALLFQALQSIVAILILELFNYVAHYGMVRAALRGGGIEPIGPCHSWNTGRRFNNWALFNGGYHSDHHGAPTLAYQHLQPVPEAPQLPSGYAETMAMALIPPLWRRVMDPRLRSWRDLSPPFSAISRSHGWRDGAGDDRAERESKNRAR